MSGDPCICGDTKTWHQECYRRALAPHAPAAQPLTDAQISKMYAKWDKNAGASIADLIRLVEAHHGIAHSVEKKASQP